MLVVAVVRETAPAERRVALVPDGASRLVGLGMQVLVEAGAGERALLPDEAYVAAGAEVVEAADLRRRADVVLRVRPPEPPELDGLRPGCVVLGLLDPFGHPDLVRRMADDRLTAVSLDTVPRTLSRAQAMDALTSQATVAGHQAVLLAASLFDGFFPMMVTAAGTTRPAQVLVLGAGVAGLQALATARRLGALVSGSDVREAARADVLSTGASFLDLGAVTASGAGGYARELTGDERSQQQAALAAEIARFDVVVTTAQVPGGRVPPLLVDEVALDALRPGSVVVDLARCDRGGNVAGSVPGATTVTPRGVVVVGAGDLVSAKPRAASTAYSRNAVAMLTALLHEGEVAVDLSDELQAGAVLTHDGEVVHPGVLARLAAQEVPA